MYVKWYWLISFVFVNGRLERLMNTDQRILGMTDQTVTYLVKDYRNGGRYIPHTINGIDFLRMFLMHVLSKGFVRIRHYGLVHTIDFWYMMKNK